MQGFMSELMSFVKNNEIPEQILVFIKIYIAYYILCIILSYIFNSVGTYRLMQKRKIPNAFLAWIPTIQRYALGKIYDDIRQKEINGKDPYFRIIMLIFTILGGGIICIIFYLIALKKIFKKYAPNKNSYFVISVIFTILFWLAPFVPDLCLMIVSKNDPDQERHIQTNR